MFEWVRSIWDLLNYSATDRANSFSYRGWQRRGSSTHCPSPAMQFWYQKYHLEGHLIWSYIHTLDHKVCQSSWLSCLQDTLFKDRGLTFRNIDLTAIEMVLQLYTWFYFESCGQILAQRDDAAVRQRQRIRHRRSSSHRVSEFNKDFIQIQILPYKNIVLHITEFHYHLYSASG